MKNPDNKPLRIFNLYDHNMPHSLVAAASHANQEYYRNYGIILSNLAIAESNLIRGGKDSALPHFLALVKELERIYGFKFEIIEPEVS